MPQGLAQLDIDTGGRFVQHDHRRFVNKCLRHQHSSFHAARELAHVGIGLVGEAQAVQQFVNPVVVVFDAKIAGLDAQRFPHVEKWIKHQLLRHHTELAARSRVIGLNVAAEHTDLAAAGAREARQNADHGGLAGTVGSEQPKEFALLNVKADPVKRHKSGPFRPARGWVDFGDGLKRDSRHESPLL